MQTNISDQVLQILSNAGGSINVQINTGNGNIILSLPLTPYQTEIPAGDGVSSIPNPVSREEYVSQIVAAAMLMLARQAWINEGAGGLITRAQDEVN